MLCATSEHTSTKVGFDLSIIEAALSNIFSCYSSFSTLGAAKILTRKNDMHRPGLCAGHSNIRHESACGSTSSRELFVHPSETV